MISAANMVICATFFERLAEHRHLVRAAGDHFHQPGIRCQALTKPSFPYCVMPCGQGFGLLGSWPCFSPLFCG